MATIDLSAINQSFAFADNPIIVKASDLGFLDGSIFRQAIFEVDTYYNKVESSKRTYIFAVNVEDGASSTECDIASALRSTFARYQYRADLITSTGFVSYPAVRYQVSVHTKYMKDGVVTSSLPTEKSVDLYAFMGGLSDMERWIGSSNINCQDAPSFTTKPSGELYDKGQLIATTTYDAANREVKTQFSTAQSGVLDTRDRTTILFVNSRGVFDTISVIGYESEERAVASEVRSLVGGVAYRPSPAITTHKEGGEASWKMSSGWVSREWAQWYAGEFLMAKHYWMPKDGQWLPVAVMPDGDSIVTYDRNDPSLLAVNFTVRAAIKG